MRKITDSSLNLLMELEGFRSHPYKDSGGRYTIGFGSTFYNNGKPVQISDSPLTKEQAKQILVLNLTSYENYVEKAITSTISDNQFSALVLFTYNLGFGNLFKSSLRKEININPNSDKIPPLWLEWNKVNGKYSQGVENRRQKELDLYFSK